MRIHQLNRFFPITLMLMVFFTINDSILAQQYHEYVGGMWGQGIDEAAPLLIDYNGDGRLEMLIGGMKGRMWKAQQMSDTVFLLVSRSMDSVSVPSELIPTAGDIDKNGLIDLLCGTNSGRISRFEQTEIHGDVFRLKDTEFAGIKMGAHVTPCLTDIDGDGLYDILIGESAGIIRRFKQDAADPTAFTLDTNKLFDEQLNAYPYPHVVDVDNNGRLDLIVTMYGDSVWRFEQDVPHSSHFTLVTKAFAGVPRLEKAGIASGDVDGDGDMDFVFGSMAGNLRLYICDNAATGSYHLQNANLLNVRDFGTETGFVVTDLDGDGLLDILSTTYGFMVNQAPGHITHLRQRAHNSTEFDIVDSSFNMIETGGFTYLNTTDIDGNGLLDLMVASRYGVFSRYEQAAGDPLQFSLRNPDFLPGTKPGNAFPSTLCDIDGNGRLDWIVGLSGRAIYRYEQHAAHDTVFDLVTNQFVPSTYKIGSYPSPVLTDLNKDGVLDLVIGSSNGNMLLYRQSAAHDTTFDYVGQNFANIIFPAQMFPAFADVNGDGLEDLFVGDACGGISLFLRETTSDVEHQSIPPAHPCIVSLSPQPASSYVRLALTHDTRTASIEMFDMLGRHVMSQTRDFAGTDHTVTISTQDLIPGIYTLRAVTGGRSETKRFTVVR